MRLKVTAILYACRGKHTTIETSTASALYFELTRFEVSTHVFLSQRLKPALLDALHRSGASTIEIFAARHHFDYTDRAAIREIAAWFRDTGTAATLHQPIFTPEQSERWSRHVPATLSLISPDKSQRIEAMDEVKRSLESAEMISISAITLHLGLKDDPWDTRAIENSLTAIEHIKAFAHPLGVKVLIENLQNEVTTPEHILEILNIGHFDNVGVTRSRPRTSVTVAWTTPSSFSSRAFMSCTCDNNRLRDEHLWPGSGLHRLDESAEAHGRCPLRSPAFSGWPDLSETADSAAARPRRLDQQLRLAEWLRPEEVLTLGSVLREACNSAGPHRMLCNSAFTASFDPPTESASARASFTPRTLCEGASGRVHSNWIATRMYAVVITANTRCVAVICGVAQKTISQPTYSGCRTSLYSPGVPNFSGLYDSPFR